MFPFLLQVRARLEAKERAVVGRTERDIETLEKDLEELRRRDQEISQLLQSGDSAHFLQVSQRNCVWGGGGGTGNAAGEPGEPAVDSEMSRGERKEQLGGRMSHWWRNSTCYFHIQGGGRGGVGGGGVAGVLSFIFHLAYLFPDPGCSSALCPPRHRLAQQRRGLAHRGLGGRQESAEPPPQPRGGGLQGGGGENQPCRYDGEPGSLPEEPLQSSGC